MSSVVRPSDLAEALQLRAGGYKLLAGGTDLYPTASAILRGNFVDLTRLAALQGITFNNGLRIGACTTWRDIAEARLPPALISLQQAAIVVGGRQIQNAGTIGGNLCNASPAGDSVPALAAADAVARISGPNGERDVPALDVAVSPGKTRLAKGEFVTSIFLPARPAHAGDAYLRFIPRTEMDIAVCSAGVNLVLDASGTITAARVALGAVAPVVLLVEAAAAAIIGSKLDAAALVRLAKAAEAACRPISDKRGTVEFRTEVAGVLTRRAATIAYARARAAK